MSKRFQHSKNRGEDKDKVLLLEKGKKGIFQIIFGRTGIVIALVIAQIVLLIALFLGPVAEHLSYFYGLIVLAAAVLVIHLANQPGDPSVKLTWAVLILAVPLVGGFLYVFVITDLGHRMIHRRLEQLQEQSLSLVSCNEPLMERLRTEEPALHALARYTFSHGGFPVYEHSRADYFPLGDDLFPVLLERLEAAEHFIFLEFFIVEEGYMWGRILRVLEDKVKEGVEVRMLYDGTCAISLLPYHYPRELEALGIQCKMFAPIRPLVSTYHNNRDHRKILVIDGKSAFTGGFNLADEYINRKVRFGHWKDTAVLVEGEAVRSFTLMFLQMWNIGQRKEDFAPYLNATVPAAGPCPGYILPYGDSPLDEERVGEMVYTDILNRAERYVHIMTPYLILNYNMISALTFAAKRGVYVRLILPHIPDKAYAFALAYTHYRELLEAGVRIYEYTPGFVHAKTFVSDDEKAVVGTINLDYRSLSLHFECAALLWKVDAVADAERDFQETLAKSQEVTLADLPKIPLKRRLAGRILKLLAPLM